MLYDSTKVLLRTIVQSLETIDESAWEDQFESAKECLFEMYQMNRALSVELRTDGAKKRIPVDNAHCYSLSRAMPHVKCMMTAIRRRDKGSALENGRLALSQM